MAGNIRIIEPRENFKRIPKSVVLDEKVDLVTLGLYVKVLTLGEKWDLNVKGLAGYLGISEDKVRRSFAVLESVGYLRRHRVQGAGGKFTGWDYEIASEPLTGSAQEPQPKNTDVGKNRTSENTDVGENRTSENAAQYKDYKEYIDYKDNNKTKKNKAGAFAPPTVGEVRAFCEERKNTIDAEAFVAFYASKGWKVGDQPMKDWHAAVVTWEKRRAAEKTTPAAPSRKSAADQRFDNMIALGHKLGFIQNPPNHE